MGWHACDGPRDCQRATEGSDGVFTPPSRLREREMPATLSHAGRFGHAAVDGGRRETKVSLQRPKRTADDRSVFAQSTTRAPGRQEAPSTWDPLWIVGRRANTESPIL